jgi:hypothetical protein
MTYRGQVKNGVVVLDNSTGLREGTRVTVQPEKAKSRSANAKKAKASTTVRPGLLKLAGKAKGLPADASRNVDHYLYGHPKQ